MRKSRIKPKSDKQKMRDAEWRACGMFRRKDLMGKYGWCVCEFCRQPEGSHEFWRFDNHHIDGNRRNNVVANSFIVHRKCHSYIHDKNIQVTQEGFEGRNER